MKKKRSGIGLTNVIIITSLLTTIAAFSYLVINKLSTEGPEQLMKFAEGPSCTLASTCSIDLLLEGNYIIKVYQTGNSDPIATSTTSEKTISFIAVYPNTYYCVVENMTDTSCNATSGTEQAPVCLAPTDTPTPTPTETPTPTPTNTPSPTPTPTPSPTAVVNNGPDLEPSPTEIPGITPSTQTPPQTACTVPAPTLFINCPNGCIISP